ncbi:helix-turn-helix domain-containing protein [Allokutzneria multivorans]|uniref:Helix-turn-helix domain-containing protein n=1 Tax=Allokutzneria multivorans TaxID=1142134 RepID=A0ABP7TVD7_9PSEU
MFARLQARVPLIVEDVLLRSTAEARRRHLKSVISHSAYRDMLTFASRTRLLRAAQRQPYQPADLERYGDFYAALADSGMPLTEVLTAGRLCFAATTSQYWAHSQPEDHVQMTALSRWMAEHSTPLFDLAVRTYASRVDPAQRSAMRHRLLADALLSGSEVDTITGSLGQAAPGPYAVCVVGGDDSALWPPQPLPHGCMTTRRLGYRVLLLPLVDDDTTTALRNLDEVVREWGPAAPKHGISVAVAEGAGDVPRAFAEATRTARLARGDALSTRRYFTVEDVLVLEGVLNSRHTSARLGRVLLPLAEHPELVETLIAFYRNDLDRTRTAAELFIARRTLNYRMDRVRQLTALDPTSTRGIVVLSTALTASLVSRAGATRNAFRT